MEKIKKIFWFEWYGQLYYSRDHISNFFEVEVEVGVGVRVRVGVGDILNYLIGTRLHK